MQVIKSFENVTVAVEFLKSEYDLNRGQATQYVMNNSYVVGSQRSLNSSALTTPESPPEPLRLPFWFMGRSSP